MALFVYCVVFCVHHSLWCVPRSSQGSPYVSLNTLRFPSVTANQSGNCSAQTRTKLTNKRTTWKGGYTNKQAPLAVGFQKVRSSGKQEQSQFGRRAGTSAEGSLFRFYLNSGGRHLNEWSVEVTAEPITLRAISVSINGVYIYICERIYGGGQEIGRKSCSLYV